MVALASYQYCLMEAHVISHVDCLKHRFLTALLASPPSDPPWLLLEALLRTVSHCVHVWKNVEEGVTFASGAGGGSHRAASLLQ